MPAPRSSSGTMKEVDRYVDDPVPEGQSRRVAAADAEGRFRFDLDKASSDLPYGNSPPGTTRRSRPWRRDWPCLGRRRIAAQGG